MLFAIHALDRPGALPERLARYEAHKAFLDEASAHGVRIVMSGPLTADDGATMIGSLFLVEAPDRGAVVEQRPRFRAVARVDADRAPGD